MTSPSRVLNVPRGRPPVTRKSSIFLLLSAVAIACVLSAIAGCRTSSPDLSLERVQASYRIAIGVDPSYPPFANIDAQGQPVGYEIDLAREIGRRLGVSADLVSIDVGGVVDALIARKIDVIISGISPDPQMSKQILFSRPYFNNGQVLIVPAGTATGIEDISGVVGFESGSGGDLEARRLEREIAGLQVKPYTTPEAAVQDVRAGRIDAALTDAITARQIAGKDAALAILDQYLNDEFYVVAAKRGDQKLLDAINEILDQLDRERYLAALADRWLR